MPPMPFSLSAMQSWQACQQKYYYSYVRKLRQPLRDLAPLRGNMLHEYLATYYTGLRTGRDPLESHQTGLAELLKHEDRLKAAGAVAFYANREQLAAEYLALLPACIAIADRYFRVHGESDAGRFDVLMVEEKLNFGLAAGIESRSVIDLVLYERDTAITWLVEHKSTGNVPDDGVRMRDLQTLLYAEVLRRQEVHPDGVLWNYIRTKEPTVPELLKKGGLTHRADIDTTWEVYRKEIQRHDLPESDYEDMRARLEPRERTVYFPRFEQVIVADTEIMLADYVNEAVAARVARKRWEDGIQKPTRTLTRNCSFCEFRSICEAALTGGDEEDVIRLRFTTSEEQQKAEETVDSR